MRNATTHHVAAVCWCAAGAAPKLNALLLNADEDRHNVSLVGEAERKKPATYRQGEERPTDHDRKYRTQRNTWRHEQQR